MSTILDDQNQNQQFADKFTSDMDYDCFQNTGLCISVNEQSDWFSRYKFCQPLGQGGMGTVYLAEDRWQNNKRCVIKQLAHKFDNPQEQSEAIRLFRRETEVLKGLAHPGIVQVIDDHVTEDGRYFLVMNFVMGRNLEILLTSGGPFAPEFITQLAIQCCETLEYLHALDPPIIYRDLKPSNLILTPEGRIVFVDFGIARTFMPKEAATRIVSAGYSPPEQYFGKPEIRSDLYSLGATISHLLTGRRPKPLAPCVPSATNSNNVNLDLIDLIRRLTAHTPEDRPLNARAVRLELYKIYAQYYPDVVIPTEEELINPINVHRTPLFKNKRKSNHFLQRAKEKLRIAWQSIVSVRKRTK